MLKLFIGIELQSNLY